MPPYHISLTVLKNLKRNSLKIIIYVTNRILYPIRYVPQEQYPLTCSGGSFHPMLRGPLYPAQGAPFTTCFGVPCTLLRGSFHPMLRGPLYPAQGASFTMLRGPLYSAQGLLSPCLGGKGPFYPAQGSIHHA
jgi:hypothetical protein